MTKIKFNYENMNAKVFPYFTSSIDALKSAIRTGNRLVIPRKFVNYYYVANLDYNLNKDLKLVQSALTDLKNNNKLIEQLLTDSKNELDAIEQIRIIKRENNVRVR